MNKLKIFFLSLLVLAAGTNAKAIDFWQYPEMAERNSIFVGFSPVTFSFARGSPSRSVHPEVYIDYMLPIGFPLSVGISGRFFSSELWGIGIRPAYHINFEDENLNIYIMYTLKADFGKINGEDFIYLEWGAGVGIRRRFGRFFCLMIETGFRLQTINIGIAVKLN